MNNVDSFLKSNGPPLAGGASRYRYHFSYTKQPILPPTYVRTSMMGMLPGMDSAQARESIANIAARPLVVSTSL